MRSKIRDWLIFIHSRTEKTNQVVNILLVTSKQRVTIVTIQVTQTTNGFTRYYFTCH